MKLSKFEIFHNGNTTEFRKIKLKKIWCELQINEQSIRDEWVHKFTTVSTNTF